MYYIINYSHRAIDLENILFEIEYFKKVVQAGPELAILLLHLLSSWITSMCHHPWHGYYILNMTLGDNIFLGYC
jgi:hypothetical protein